MNDDWIDITEPHPTATPAGLAQRIVDQWKTQGVTMRTAANLEHSRRTALRLVKEDFQE